MGGAHVTVMPDEALMYCDSVLIGPAENVWPQVIKDYENGELNKIYRGELNEEILSQVNEKTLSLQPSELVDLLN